MSVGIKRLGLAVAAVFAMGFSALLAVSLAIPADIVRERVKAQIEAVTGLDPVLSGKVAVSLFPTGSVRFDDVRLGDQGTGTSVLTTEQLVVRLRFFPLLLGQIETIYGLDYIDSYLQRINAVTADDVADVCTRYLNENNRTVGQLLSDGSESDGEDDSEAE